MLYRHWYDFVLHFSLLFLTVLHAQYLMSFYLFLSDRHGRGSGTRWAIMGMAVKLAQSIGLREFEEH